MTNWQVKDITPKAWAKQRGRTALRGRCIDVIALLGSDIYDKNRKSSDPVCQQVPWMTLTNKEVDRCCSNAGREAESAAGEVQSRIRESQST